MHSILVTESHPERARVEAHIRSIFKQVHAAQVMNFPGMLVSSVSPEGDIICSAGIRTENSGFFSEIYLDKPVECLIAQAMGRPVIRSEVLEIVSLASNSVRPCLNLLDDITLFGRQRGYKWCLFTGTSKLRRLLKQTGLEVIKLVPADIEKVSEPEQWGDYYATDPWVCLLKNIPSIPLDLLHRHRRLQKPRTEHLPNLERQISA